MYNDFDSEKATKFCETKLLFLKLVIVILKKEGDFTKYLRPSHKTSTLFELNWVKVAFIQKAWMNLSFLQTDKPHYFPELEF